MWFLENGGILERTFFGLCSTLISVSKNWKIKEIYFVYPFDFYQQCAIIPLMQGTRFQTGVTMKKTKPTRTLTWTLLMHVTASTSCTERHIWGINGDYVGLGKPVSDPNLTRLDTRETVSAYRPGNSRLSTDLPGGRLNIPNIFHRILPLYSYCDD